MKLVDICQEIGINLEDARLMFIDSRPDWTTFEDLTEAEAELIRRSVNSNSPESNNEIQPVNGLKLSQQQQLISNASQVLGIPLVLSVQREIKTVEAVESVKNTLILNLVDRKQAELDAAIKQRSDARQQVYLMALQDLADNLQQPIDVVTEMTQDIEAGNEQLEAILQRVKGGK
ncbi:MAG: hypothetical protein AAF757_00105 [Cyanobacteria bacterium P01_D01_bin.116]